MKARIQARRLAAAAAVIALASVSGCDSVKLGSDKPTSPATKTVTQTVSANPSSTASESVPSASATPTGPVALKDRALTADHMPGFTAKFRWRAGTTRTREPKTLFGTCQRFMITAIGATRIVVDEYVPASGPPSHATAGNLVAQFPDEVTAQRAYEVLKSWHDECQDLIAKHTQHKVGDLQPVDVGGAGNGDWYLLRYGPVAGDPDSSYFDAQGMTRSGDRISLLEMRLVGQDYDYRPGHEPMVAAVQAAAAKLG
jgi:hypothetical protein